MILQHVHVLRHSYHSGNESLTIRAKVFKDTSKSIHITLITHLLQYKNDGIHRMPGSIHVLDGTLLNAQILLDKVVVLLQGYDEFRHRSGTHLRHQEERIRCRTKGQQLAGSDTSSTAHTGQSLGKLYDIGRCSSRGGRQFEHGRTRSKHRFFDTHLRDKTHRFHHLRKSRERFFSHLLTNGYIDFVSCFHELSHTIHTILTHTEFCTLVGKLSQTIDGSTSIYLSQFLRQFVDILHRESGHLTNIRQR